MSTTITRVVLFGNTCQMQETQSVMRILGKLREAQCKVSVEAEFADVLRLVSDIRIDDFPIVHYAEIKPEQFDFVISMGGDGTFLRTAAYIGRLGLPILGINTGHLGFLADVMPDQIETAIDDVLGGHCVVEQRRLLKIEKDGVPLSTFPYALNEVSVLKYDNSSLINVTTEIDGELLANYVADGVIVCTPTGSTGYSLSVNGPIVAPNSQSFCISAVAPHSLNVRPVILNDDVTITLHVHSRSHKYLISIDGRCETFSDGDTLQLSRADYTIGVMKVKHLSFFDTLRDKMLWGADQRFN